MPNTEYQLLINVVSASDLIGNSSHFIRFVAPDGGKKMNSNILIDHGIEHFHSTNLPVSLFTQCYPVNDIKP